MKTKLSLLTLCSLLSHVAVARVFVPETLETNYSVFTFDNDFVGPAAAARSEYRQIGGSVYSAATSEKESGSLSIDETQMYRSELRYYHDESGVTVDADYSHATDDSSYTNETNLTLGFQDQSKNWALGAAYGAEKGTTTEYNILSPDNHALFAGASYRLENGMVVGAQVKRVHENYASTTRDYPSLDLDTYSLGFGFMGSRKETNPINAEVILSYQGKERSESGTTSWEEGTQKRLGFSLEKVYEDFRFLLDSTFELKKNYSGESEVTTTYFRPTLEYKFVSYNLFTALSASLRNFKITYSGNYSGTTEGNVYGGSLAGGYRSKNWDAYLALEKVAYKMTDTAGNEDNFYMNVASAHVAYRF